MTDLLLALVFGAVIGISLGALGGGGSILTVPVLVYVLHQSASDATTASLVIVGVTAALAAAGHTRSGNVRWGAGVAFGLVGVAASFAGTALNRHVDPNVLLLSFAALMIAAATAMVRRSGGGQPTARAVPVDPTPALPDGGSGGTLTAERTAVLAGPQVIWRAETESRTAIVTKVLVAGTIVGFLTGFLGVGGGFVIVPALVMALGFPMPVAVGTSLLVIALNSATALVARTGTASFHWAVIVPFTVAAVVGSLAGKRIADRVSGATLSKAFAGLLVAVAVYVGLRSGFALL